MALDHGRQHGHGASDRGGRHPPADPSRALGAAVGVAAALLLLEAAGGLYSHSLALLSDAGHMLTDVLSLGLAWYAAGLARRPPTPRRSYGYHRAGILAALGNAALLIVVAGGILAEVATRLRHPVPVTAWVMWAVASAGLGGNLAIGLRLGRAPHAHGHGENLNVRSSWLHAMGDAAASAGVIAAGVLVALTHRLWWDPAVSAAISLGIAWGAWGIIARTLNVLMEGTPRGIDPEAVAAAIEEDPAVLSVHHLHVWSLDGVRRALSGHLVLRDGLLSETGAVIARVAETLRAGFAIEHTTLQLESSEGVPCPGAECAPPLAVAGTPPQGGAR